MLPNTNKVLQLVLSSIIIFFMIIWQFCTRRLFEMKIVVKGKALGEAMPPYRTNQK